MNVIRTLKSDGASKGLCQDWQKKLNKQASVKRLSELFIRGIDFCISENYPTLEFMRDNFKGKCEPYGIYIDEYVILINKPDVVLNGKCEADLMYDGFSVSKVYVRHNSKAVIHAQQHSLVTIDVFDDSYTQIITDSGNKASVLVYVYGNAKVESVGMGIKIVHKNKNTY